jgi:hypothetical protein
MRRFIPMTIVAAIAAVGLVACTQQPNTMTFKAHLTAKDEVPPNASAGMGDGTFMLNSTTKELTWTVTYSGLTGPATLAHLHGPAKPGENKGVAVPLGPNGNLPSPISGKATLTDAQMADLQAGMYYANIHTDANKGGEIRGQVMK